MGQIIAAIIPVVLTITVGVWMRRLGVVSDHSAQQLNKLVYWCCLPAFLIWRFSSREPLAAAAWPWSSLGAMAATIGVVIVILLLTAQRLGPARLGSVICTAFRSNGAFVGLPIAALLVSEGVLAEQGIADYLVLLALVVPLFNIMSVVAFVVPHHGLRLGALVPVLRGLITNPILWGCLLGVAASYLPLAWRIDGWVQATLSLVGEPAVPLALIAAGASLEFTDLRHLPAAVWIGVVGKLVLTPAIALSLAWLAGANQAELAVLAVMTVSPAAVASVPMAAELGGDVRVAASGVVVTTLLAPLSVVIWLSLLLV